MTEPNPNPLPARELIEAVQDPARGYVLRVRTAGDPDTLRSALAAFSFHTEFVD